MKNKRAIMATSFIMIASLSGCGLSEGISNLISKDNEEPVEEGPINYETSTRGIDSTSKEFEEQLVEDSYYVVHEGIYYPLMNYYKNWDKNAGDYVSEDRLMFFTSNNENEIPTLFPGDHIVYYSSTNLLEQVDWERYLPMDATFGVFGLEKTAGGRYYVDVSYEDGEYILPDSDLIGLMDLGSDLISIDRVGGLVVDDSVVEQGMIFGGTKDESYDIEVYNGTYYNYFKAVANTLPFKAYELFASTEINTLQDKFWEIEIPEYFETGYYNINNAGLIRVLVGEQSYDESTKYDEPILYTENEHKGRYSSIESLNFFTQNIMEDKVGYVNPDEKENNEFAEADQEKAADKKNTFKASVVKEVDLWFPDGKDCTIKITTNSGESTGKATLEFESGGETELVYNRFDQDYTAVVKGKGTKGKLSISGFNNSYSIVLTNAEKYSGQDFNNLEAVDIDLTPTTETEAQVKTEEQGIQSEVSEVKEEN